MEQLVRRAPRLERVVVDVAESHRRADGVRGLLVRPPSPRDQQRTLRVRVQVVHALEEFLALELLRSASRQHHGDRRVVLTQRLQLRQRSLGRRAADDLVVARVALQLGGDPVQRLGVLVDRQDEREVAHRSGM